MNADERGSDERTSCSRITRIFTNQKANSPLFVKIREIRELRGRHFFICVHPRSSAVPIRREYPARHYLNSAFAFPFQYPLSGLPSLSKSSSSLSFSASPWPSQKSTLTLRLFRSAGVERWAGSPLVTPSNVPTLPPV